MTADVEDLFGTVRPAPDDIPRRGSREYLTYLHSLPLPAGLRFWSLADALVDVPAHVESIWCVDRQQRFHRLLVDRRTGQTYAP